MHSTVLFSGHMVDAPGRPSKRFPPSLEPAVTSALRRKLDEISVTKGDLALASAACGGDLIFGELVLERGLRLRVYLPLPRYEFIRRSVEFAGAGWVRRFEEVTSHAEVFHADEVLGALPAGQDVFERNNVWMLEDALSCGREGLSFLALWDGKSGDGPGGTRHMIDVVKKAGGAPYVVDITRLGSDT